ncbi:flagellar biosynthetic protein FliO [Solimicrobium silvestre]|uniref:Flagellar biosynthesis protein, FliO n=1 Tax=Solimicrobium silvestre TaxID=2099400 RepID=A0A2S9H1U2_9BURK|nr:flagellar biosynthetic protein FliO [Solimicrobium silvestre]PRC93920.1 Flagellar biosynthesis protein, FliO [Solimicrobium silvestre]
MNSLKRRSIAVAGLVAVIGMQVSSAYANAVTLPANIPFKSTTVADDNLVYRAIAAFLIAGAVAFGLAWCIKNFMPSFNKKMKRDKQLERLESMRLSTRSMLVRVRWGDEELLVGESEHGVTLIGKRPMESIIAAEATLPETTKVKGSHE